MAVNEGVVNVSTTGPSNVIIEISCQITLFNSLHALIAPTPEY